MKKYILSLIAIVLVSFSFAQEKKGMVVIKGTFSGDLGGYNKIYLYNRTSNDSAVIRDGHYTFSFPFSGADLRMLVPQYVMEKGMMYQPYGILIAEAGTYYINSDVTKGMNASILKGPESMILFQRFSKDQDEAYPKINNAIAAQYGKEWYKIDEKSPVYDRFQKSYDSLQNVYMLPLVENLVKKHPDSYASSFVLSGSGRELGSLEKKEQLLAMLSPRIRKSTEGQNFADYIQGLKSSAIGKEVANFVLPDPAGKNVDFKDLKGKYVLIDFWASWCSPCRQSFPHMREVYKKYKGDKFEIYSISIDKDKAAWLKAIKEENNPWIQSLDTKNISQKGFAVTGVPSTFLISPDGKIMAKEVGFDETGNGEIEKKLAELFGESVPMKSSIEKSKGDTIKAAEMVPMSGF